MDGYTLDDCTYLCRDGKMAKWNEMVGWQSNRTQFYVELGKIHMTSEAGTVADTK